MFTRHNKTRRVDFWSSDTDRQTGYVAYEFVSFLFYI